MPELLEDFLQSRPPTADKPLWGRTMLAVEDSRYVSDVLRLMCQRSGARLRRADSLRAAARHLRTYRPSIVVVDLGLPDGSGLDLIRDLNMADTRVDVLIALSGDDSLADDARAAGADTFMSKPLNSLAHFQNSILGLLPPEARPAGLRPLSTELVEPDYIALRDDLQHAALMLCPGRDRGSLAYTEGFLYGLAKCANDDALSGAVADLKAARIDGKKVAGHLSRLAGLVADRLAAQPTV